MPGKRTAGMRLWASIRLRLWQLAHWRAYLPEMRYGLWRVRIGLALRRGRRRGKKPVLFYLAVWGHAPFLLPIVRELRRRAPDLDLYLAVDQPGDHPEAAPLGIARWRWRPLRDYLPIRGFRMFVTPANNIRHHPPWPRRVCVFHSQPAKGVNFQDEYLRRFDVLFLLGPLYRCAYEAYAKHYPETAARLRTFDVGYPKLDGLVRGDYRREDILGGLGLAPARSTVIFAPSFGKGAALDVYGEAVFQALAELAEEGFNVIVKLHPVAYDPTVRQVHFAGKDWPGILQDYVRRTRLRDAGNVDLTPFLAASDVMVTDVSSAALDFMLLDRPVVFLDCPEFLAQVGKPGPYHTFLDNPGGDLRAADVGRSAGVVVPDPEAMKQAVRKSLENPGELSEARRRIRDQLLYHPGHAAGKAAQVLLDLLEEEEG